MANTGAATVHELLWGLVISKCISILDNDHLSYGGNLASKDYDYCLPIGFKGL